MHFQLIEKKKVSMFSLWRGAWLVALMGTLLSLLGSANYFWAVLPGVALVIAVGFLPRKQQVFIGLGVFALCAVWFLLRDKPILNGLGYFANRLFALSEASQGYYYDYFTIVGEAPAESLAFVTCIIAVLCILLGGAVNLLLSLLIAVAVAYFGVAPGIVWLCALLITAFINALPKQGRWLPALLIAAVVAATAFSITTVAPEPNLKITTLIEQFWEFFVPPTSQQDVDVPITEPTDMETTPEQEEPPEEETSPSEETVASTENTGNPEETAPTEDIEFPEYTGFPEEFLPSEDVVPPEYEEPPEYEDFPEETVAPEEVPAEDENLPTQIIIGEPVPGGTQGYEKRKLPVAVTIILSILALVAVWELWVWHINKKRKRYRIAMHAKDNAEAVRSMFLYAKRWRKLQADPGEIPPEVESIWLEAAYSEHKITDAQRKVMRNYMRKTAKTVWRTLHWWKRFLVYWYYAL